MRVLALALGSPAFLAWLDSLGRQHSVEIAQTRDELDELLSSEESNSFGAILLDHAGKSKQSDSTVIELRMLFPRWKFIVVNDELNAQEMRSHQKGKAGGDAYFSTKTSASMLGIVLEDFAPPPLPNEAGKIVITARGTEKERLAGDEILARYGLSDTAVESLKEQVASSIIQKSFDKAFGETQKPSFTSLNVLQNIPALPPEDDEEALSGDEMSLIDDTPEPPITELDSAHGEDDMATQDDKELALDDMVGLELGGDDAPAAEAAADDGAGLDLDLGGDIPDLGSAGDVSLSASEPEDAGLDLSADAEDLSLGGDDDLSLGGDDIGGEELSLGGDDGLTLGGDDSASDELTLGGTDLSADALEKLKEIDALMADDPLPSPADDISLGDDLDLTGDSSADLAFSTEDGAVVDSGADGDLDVDLTGGLDLGGDEELSFGGEEETIPAVSALDETEVDVSQGLDIGGEIGGEELDFGGAVEPEDEITQVIAHPAAKTESKPVASTKRESVQESLPPREEYQQVVGRYGADLERLQATINNLRTDREELLKKIETLEEDKVRHDRILLGLRAEVDEKKIEITILKKRAAEETADLKYRLELADERRALADEKLKVAQEEAMKLVQKAKLDARKVSSRERELEQKLELLKSDAETQIRHRDSKILELKRKIDTMEFDMENMSVMERKSVENRHELEEKLDKAIKTLRTAIGVLESEDSKLATLEKLKKNIDM